MSNAKTHIIVGMSGGVDSSVTAMLLKQQGYRVSGLFMKNWDEDDSSEYCTAKKDLADAQAVSDRIGITLHTANFAAEYWDNVFEYFLSEYKAGRTPNPDVLCNREIKFKVFLDYAETLGADYIATGHYARVNNSKNGAQLLKGLDASKDQSYFLHQVSSEQFSKTLFPLGEFEKSHVRALAKSFDLETQAKKDSTGICFIGERRFNDFLSQYLPAQPGDIISGKGVVMGQHDGLMFHTLGQRKGLKIGGVQGADELPWYVAKKDLEKNQLIIVQGADHPALFQKEMYLNEMHWINDSNEKLMLSNILNCTCKTRYRQQDQSCTLHKTHDGFYIEFDEPQRSVTPGQYAVFYLDDVCLGGGVIEHAQ